MQRFRHDDVEIAYLDEGEGEPIVLVHGFASNKEVNWVHPGWIATLTKAGRRAIALDNRGHGASTKLYDPAAYHSAVMARGRARAARSSRPRARRRHGLLDGRAHRGVPGARASRARAQRRPRRARQPPGRGRRPAANRSPMRSRRRRSPTCTIPQGRDVPRLRRADPLRPAGARRLHPRLAPDADARRGGADPDAGAGRGRHQGRGRGLRAGARRAAAAGRRRSTSPAATTCWRSATRSSRPACSTSWPARP